ncbi:MAG TPA: hypothetical protein VKR06_00275 [Ktedonosporobacter sp.]|nr:hypothetical protein [Ktedonosporobacter sp.]
MDTGNTRPPRPRKTPRVTPNEYDEYDEYEYQGRPRRRPPQRPRPARRRRAWPILLAGCALGVFCTVVAAAIIVFLALRTSQGSTLKSLPGIPGMQTFTQDAAQTVPLSTITQMQVCDKIGNVNIAVDPTMSSTTGATVTTRKIVQATTKADADQQFQRIGVEIQPPGTITNASGCPRPATNSTADTAVTPTPSAATNPTALTVNVTIPDGSSNSVDISIVIPPGVLPQNGPTMLLDVEAPVGKVTVNGLGGVLNIRGSTGDVVVTNAILADGSHIETGQGNVTFNGKLIFPQVTDPKNPPRFVILSERGNIDVTLPVTTPVTLDANTNIGSINSEFTINVQNNKGSASYHGPLNSSSGDSPATLVLDVSTGSVNIHKAQG